MRKFLIAAVSAAVAIAGLAALATADEGRNGTSWTFSFGSKSPGKATGSNSIIEPAEVDDKGTADESDDRLKPPSKSVIRFPKGSSIDTGALAACKASPSDVQRGTKKCPAKTKIGSGRADSVIGQSEESKGTDIVAPIEAFNRKGGILFVVRPCSPGTGPTKGAPCDPIPGGTVVLEGKWTKVNTRPTLTVPTPPSLLQGGVIIKRFQLKTSKKTKKTTVRVDGRTRTVVRSYATTPGTCKGTWKSSATETYTDGTKQTIPDSMPCNRG